MQYIYYPGCSLEASAIEYDRSTRAVMAALDADLVEIDGWSCCGATAAEPVSSLLSFALPARNLALAEQMKRQDGQRGSTPTVDSAQDGGKSNEKLNVLGSDKTGVPGSGKTGGPSSGDCRITAETVMVPCSACYLNLKKVEMEKWHDPALSADIDACLSEENLTLKGTLTVRHLLDILAFDIGPEAIQRRVTKTLSGLKIAPYYGCQCLRPYPLFDDPVEPRSMEPLIKACGADVFSWEMGAQCCGASGMNTKKKSAEKLVRRILTAAGGADAIVTVCPMCQLNLEGFQKEISRTAGEDLSISILYLPQLIGMAMGLSKEEIMLHKNLAVKKKMLEQAA